MSVGPKHVSTHRIKKDSQDPDYGLKPCPNSLNVKEHFGDAFCTTEKDDETALSCEDKKFQEMMETSIREKTSWKLGDAATLQEPHPRHAE